MGGTPLPAGFDARPPVREEVEALVAILAACELEYKTSSDITVNDFLGDLEGIDLAQDALVITDERGSPVAYADTDQRGDTVHFTYAYVLPGSRGQGLGTHILQWGEDRAKEKAASAPSDARIVARQYINALVAPAQSLVQAHGYERVRVTQTMAIDLTSKPAAPTWPPGLAVRCFITDQDEEVAYEAYEEAFADMWGRPRGTFEKFMAFTRRPYHDPALWFLATDGNEVAATLFGSDIDGKGWIDVVGVRRPWRGQGLAGAMLLHAFGAYWERGISRIGLSVDAQSPTGADRLYKRVGMHLDESYFVYEKELRPGVFLETPQE